MRRCLSALASFALCACVDVGGVVSEYQKRATTYTGPLPLDCRSACTYYLYKGCVTPSHVLMFHEPRVIERGVQRPLTDKERQAHLRRALNFLPEGMREIYATEWQYNQDGVFITGQQAIDMGARECD